MADKKTVLIVDDDEPLRSGMRTLLKINGYNVLEANSMHKALEVFTGSKEPVDLLLTDYDMKAGDDTGVALIKKLRSEYNFSAPAILLSGSDENMLKALLKPIPNSSFVKKPPEWDYLLVLVEDKIAGANKTGHTK